MSDLTRQLQLPPALAEAAIDLAKFHVAEVAWSRANALALLEHLAGRPVVVLGGDALASVDPLEYAYANWHADLRPEETLAQYAARSQRVAREYIERYPSEPVWFVFVLAGLADAAVLNASVT